MDSGKMFKLLLLLLLSIWQTSGQCNLPASWVGRNVFIDMNLSDYIVSVQTTSTTFNIFGYQQGLKISLPATCSEAREEGEDLLISWSETVLLNLGFCHRITEGNHGNLLFYENAVGEATNIDTDCTTPPLQYRLAAQVADGISETSSNQDIIDTFVNMATSSTADLREGTYQAEVEDIDGRSCQADEACTVEVTSNKLITNLGKEEYNLELTWMDDFSPEGSDTTGDVAFLMDLSGTATDNLPFRFYCARYKEFDDDQVKMCIETGDLNTAICSQDMNYETVAPTVLCFNFTYPVAPPTTPPLDTGGSGKVTLTFNILVLAWLILQALVV